MKTFTCKVAQRGFFSGPVHFVPKICVEAENRTIDCETELERLRAAVQQLKDQLSEAVPAADTDNAAEPEPSLCAADADHAGDIDDTVESNPSLRTGDVEGGGAACSGNDTDAMAEVVLSILSDETFLSKMEQAIREQHLSAPAAVRKAADDCIELFRTMHSDYLRSRQDDIRGVANELIAVLEGMSGVSLRERSVLAAEEISPAQLLSVDEKMIGGLLTERGSGNSHAAILAGTMGIPYLYGSSEAVAEAECAAYIILDGEVGTVITDPDPETRRAAEERMAQIACEQAERAAAMRDEQAEGEVYCRTKVYANIANIKDLEALRTSGADGVGLLRTEFLFMERDTAPDEEEQYATYRAVLDAMGDKPVVIRTMDIGSDKRMSWLTLPEEPNPALGLRGVRVSLEHKDLLHTQLRALLRAGVCGNLKVMVPMIASAWEIEEVKEQIRTARQELEQEGTDFRAFELGIMVETPAAAVCAEELARQVSFFSIGTNDLTQYTLAIDREAQGLDRYFDPHHEAVFRMIRMAAEGGHSYGVRTCVCGQLGADPEALERLLTCGVDSVSVPISRVRAVKKAAAAVEAKLAGKGPGQGTEPQKEGSNAREDCNGEEIPVVPAMETAAAADGELIPMEEIPDEAFSSGSLGECYGILPSDGRIYAPVAGTVSNIAEARHAVIITDDAEKSFLIHVGIDTVKLEGKPFVLHVSQGERVKRDQLIMEADIAAIEQAGLSPMVIVAALENS